MARIALLSAGPKSLSLFKDSDNYDIRIGINSAVTKYQCDWWSCGDAYRFEEIEELGCPKLFMLGPEIDKVRAHQPERIEGRSVEAWEDVGYRVAAPDKWTTWSVIAGIVLARWLNATSLDVFGHDMVGEIDCTGERSRFRNAGRWEKERLMWLKMLQWSQISKVTVHNVSRVLYPNKKNE